MKCHRNSAKALIIQNNKILTIELANDNDKYYLLPGGGQNYNEDLYSALKRECLEEINAKIEIGDLRYIREYISKDHEFADTDDAHQIEFIFKCKLLNDNLKIGHVPDNNQVGFKWLDIDKIQNFKLYPQTLREYLCHPENTKNPVYLGAAN